MIWALLAILGVPIWLVVGGLGASLWSRHRFRDQPGVFKLAMRSGGAEKWPWAAAYGRIVHDVVVVTSGLALVRTAIHAISVCRPLHLEEEVRGFDSIAFFELTLDDGSVFEVGVEDDAAEYFAGLPGPQRSGASGAG